jgi:hypothetical protein
MNNEELAFNEIYYGINAAIFISGLGIALLSSKFSKGLVLKAAIIVSSLLIFSYSFIKYTNHENSKYKIFDLKRCANNREIISRFRSWSKIVHPDSQNEFHDEQITYEELNILKEFLLDSNKRLFYDKFNQIYERQDFDEKESKEVHNFLFQNKLFEYLNLTFAWIFVTFLVSKYLNKLQLTNFILKILIAKTFLIVYYLYSQSEDTCSFLDDLFVHLTIYQQIYYSEFWFSFAFGLAIGHFNQYIDDSKQKSLGKLSQTSEVLTSLNDKTDSETKLLEKIQNYYQYLNN